MNATIPVDKNSVEYQENLIKATRTNLLVAVAFSVLNVGMLLFGGGRYFLFSMTLPYYLTLFGYSFDYFMVSTYTYTGLVLAAVPVLAMGLCWLMSKKDNRWLLGGLVVFGLDTAALLGLLLWTGDPSGVLLDIVFHAWVIISLIRGWQAVQRLKTMPPQPPVEMPLEQQMAEEFSEIPEGVIDSDCPV